MARSPLSLDSSFHDDGDNDDDSSVALSFSATPSFATDVPILRRRLVELEAQVEHLQEGRRLLESHLQTKEKRWEQEMASLRAELSTTKQWKEDAKKPFYDLEISEALYEELTQHRKNEELSLREYVLVQTHGKVRILREELEQARRRFQEAQRQAMNSAEQLHLQVEEHLRTRQTLEAREAALKAEMKEKDGRIKELEVLVEGSKARVKEQAEKENAFDTLQSRLTTAQNENAELRALTDRQAIDLRRLADIGHRHEVILLDKEFLVKEVEGLKGKADTLHANLTCASAEIQELTTQRDDLTRQMQEASIQAKLTYKESLEKELRRIQDDHTKEVIEAKAMVREGFEKEIIGLQESRQDAMTQVERVRREFQDLQHVHQDLLLRLAKAETTYQVTVTELRGDNKMKTFEITRHKMMVDEKTKALQHAERHIEHLKATIESQRQDLLELQGTASKKECELSLALQNERDKVASFRVLETQLDKALLGVDDEDTRWSSSSSRQRASALAHGGGVQYAMRLANKLEEREKELERWKREGKEAKSNVQVLEKNVQELTHILLHASQPGQYIVQLIREKDQELDVMRQQQQQLQRKVEEAQWETQRLSEDKVKAQKELQLVKCQRQDIQRLRDLVKEVQCRSAASTSAVASSFGCGRMKAKGKDANTHEQYDGDEHWERHLLLASPGASRQCTRKWHIKG